MKNSIDENVNNPVPSSTEIRNEAEAAKIDSIVKEIELLKAKEVEMVTLLEDSRDQKIHQIEEDADNLIKNFREIPTVDAEEMIAIDEKIISLESKKAKKIENVKDEFNKQIQKIQTKTEIKTNALKDKKEILEMPETAYSEESQTVVRLVSKKQMNTHYQVIGIEETISKNNWKAWIYLGPIIVLVGVFLLYPLINTIFIAFTKNYSQITGEFDGLTFDNFGVILGLTSYNGAYEVNFTRYAIPNTFFLLLTVPISTLLALLIAVALNSIKWFKKALQTIFFLPYVTNTIAVGMVFSVIFDNSGLINFIFKSDTVWIYGADRWVAMVPLMIYIVWNALPFKILILLSGLQGIDKQYYQAAQIDSASRGKVLTKITIPLLSPQILYILVTSFMGAFKEYTAVVGLFNGPGTLGVGSEPNMETVVYYVYDKMSTQTSFAAAAAVFLFVIILCFTALQFWAGKKRVYY